MKELQNVSALEENLQNAVNEYPNLRNTGDLKWMIADTLQLAATSGIYL
ncbi:uncharacterized protein G2W53_010884 [Senna tora]|uniref:Uncharacterized protein n=1 Tax=Senna tora TaxID=362788 RepID=A0A835CC75_9FABA|nr:uncharacterized protein G2W53_010884 [Senna tora]